MKFEVAVPFKDLDWVGKLLLLYSLIDGRNCKPKSRKLGQPTKHTIRPELRQDYPLNLSISISGGKETNKDSPSSGERNGKSPRFESGGKKGEAGKEKQKKKEKRKKGTQRWE